MVTQSIIRYRIMQVNNVLNTWKKSKDNNKKNAIFFSIKINVFISVFFITLFLSMPSQAKMQHNIKTWQGVVVRSGELMIASGVPITPCHVLTNEHVIRGSKRATVRYKNRRYPANVVDIQHHHDLALLELPACPIQNYAHVSNIRPKTGDTLTSVYYKPGINFLHQMIRTTGVFLGYHEIVTEEDKTMLSMMIDDKTPRIHASGGGVSTKDGLVSVIFGVIDNNKAQATFAVSYDGLRSFLDRNGL